MSWQKSQSAFTKIFGTLSYFIIITSYPASVSSALLLLLINNMPITEQMLQRIIQRFYHVVIPNLKRHFTAIYK